MGCNIFFGMLCRVFYVGEYVILQHGIFSSSLARVLTFDEAVVQHPSAFALADMQDTPNLFARQGLR